jgi:hypothetical protein
MTGSDRKEGGKRSAQEADSLVVRNVWRRLKAAGMASGSGWPGYERAKRLIIGDEWIEPEEYHRLVRVICRALKI